MDKRHIPLVSLLAWLVASAAWATAVSDPFMVTACREQSLLWNTVTHETESIQIEWPESAVSARIEASTGQTLDLSDKSVTSVNMAFGRPKDAASERVIDLTLIFFDADGQPISNETRTAQLGWVRGCGADTFDLRPSDTNCHEWVMAAATGVLFLGGDPEAFGTNGVSVALDELPQRWWFETEFPSAQPLLLSLLAADGTQYERSVLGIIPGTLILFR